MTVMTAEKNAPGAADAPQDDEAIEGDRGIPQVGRPKGPGRLVIVMGVGVIIVCLIALAAMVGLNKVQNRNVRGSEPSKPSVAASGPSLAQSAFARSDEPPPVPESIQQLHAGDGSQIPGQPRQLTPEEQRELDLAERRKRAPAIAVAGSIPAPDGSRQAGAARQGQPGAAGGPLGQSLRATRTNAVTASLLPEPDLTITQGKLLQCTLETAINSALPGMTSCVLAQDVYSTTGRVLLLERGTRIVGQYQGGSVRQGQSRLFVLWTRAETPNGVLIHLDSPSTDTLGRSGVDGKINRHFWERFGAALLVSLVDDVASYVVARERNSGSGNNTAINFGGTTAESGRDAASIIVENSVNIPPTLNKAQGESIGIFVARDLYFGDVYELKPVSGTR